MPLTDPDFRLLLNLPVRLPVSNRHRLEKVGLVLTAYRSNVVSKVYRQIAKLEQLHSYELTPEGLNSYRCNCYRYQIDLRQIPNDKRNSTRHSLRALQGFRDVDCWFLQFVLLPLINYAILQRSSTGNNFRTAVNGNSLVSD